MLMLLHCFHLSLPAVITPGQGMYFSAASNAYRAVNCDSNSYGVKDLTYGLAAFPCRDCPAGMETSTTAAPSSTFYTAGSGFTSPMACVTKAGYGYNGRVATKCPAGSYNAGGNYATCTKCAAGLTTADDASLQTTSSDCKLGPGYGFHNNAIVPCPIGECCWCACLLAAARSVCTIKAFVQKHSAVCRLFNGLLVACGNSPCFCLSASLAPSRIPTHLSLQMC